MKPSLAPKGFTLVEMMVVIAILAVLSAIAYPSYMTYVQRARLENARAAMSDIMQQMERYYGENRSFCQTGNAVCTAPALTGTETDYYTLTINSVTASNYVLTATPKTNVYSAGDLANKMLNMVYHSNVGSVARCTNTGLKESLTANAASVSGCEVM